MKTLIFGSLLAFLLGCDGDKKKSDPPSNPEIPQTPSKPSWAGNCDVDYFTLKVDKLNAHNVVIDDRGIDDPFKIVHLNEMNSLPESYLKIIGEVKVPFKFANGSVVDFEELSQLKGQRLEPNSEVLWDYIGGLAAQSGVYIGTIPTGGNSVSIHESGHVIGSVYGLTTDSQELERLFQFYVERQATDDIHANYRFSSKSEFFAVGFDEYYCSASTRGQLLSFYPDLHEYFQSKLDDDLSVLPIQKTFDSQRDGE